MKLSDILNKYDKLTGKGKSTIEQISHRAAEIFSEKGYVSTTLVDISHITGISKGGIYHYFSSKEDLLFFIINRFMTDLIDGLKEEIETIPPEKRIGHFIRWHIDKLSVNMHQSKLTFHESKSLPPRYWKILRKKRKEYYRILVFAIESSREVGAIDQKRLTVAAYSLLGMINWILWWYNPKGPVSTRDLSKEIHEIFMGKFFKR